MDNNKKIYSAKIAAKTYVEDHLGATERIMEGIEMKCWKADYYIVNKYFFLLILIIFLNFFYVLFVFNVLVFCKVGLATDDVGCHRYV